MSPATECKAEPKQTTTAAIGWRGVFFFGPEPVQDKEGEEQPSWAVFVGDEDGNPIKTVYHVHNFKRALGLARLMAQDRRLELINEAQEA